MHPGTVISHSEVLPEAVGESIQISAEASTSDGEMSETFDELFALFQPRVLAWCMRIVRDRELAEDLAQEVFLKVWRHRHTWRGDSRFSTWLFAVTRNHALSRLKRTDHEVQMDPMLDLVLRDERQPAPDTGASHREMIHRAVNLLRSLEPIEARVMVLHYAHDVPLAEITHTLGLRNPSGAKAYIVNARRKLDILVRRRGWKLIQGSLKPGLAAAWAQEVAA